SRSAKQTFNANGRDAGRVKAKSRHNAKRKTVAKFSLACLKAKRSARLSGSWCATKMHGQTITRRSQTHFGPRMQISHTWRNTEFEIGRVAVALQRGKR